MLKKEKKKKSKSTSKSPTGKSKVKDDPPSPLDDKKTSLDKIPISHVHALSIGSNIIKPRSVIELRNNDTVSDLKRSSDLTVSKQNTKTKRRLPHHSDETMYIFEESKHSSKPNLTKKMENQPEEDEEDEEGGIYHLSFTFASTLIFTP